MRQLAVALIVVGIAIPATARAQHHHGGDPPRDDDAAAHAFGVGVALIAASFDTELYAGDYQAVMPTARFAYRSIVVSAALPIYRLQENGLSLYGPGDAVVHAQGTFVRRASLTGGVALTVSLPTGAHVNGLGMGHTMLMPSVWAAFTRGDVTVGANVGYGAGVGDAEHVHGIMWPLVEPMNLHEITWATSADLKIAKALRAGVRVLGASPIGSGLTRVVGGARVAWTEGRVETGIELQAGIAGDPFVVRGVAETTVSF